MIEKGRARTDSDAEHHVSSAVSGDRGENEKHQLREGEEARNGLGHEARVEAVHLRPAQLEDAVGQFGGPGSEVSKPNNSQ